MLLGSVYGWLQANGLWPTFLGAVLYWLVPIAATFLAGKRVLGRAWRELVALWHHHNDAQNRLAKAHEAQAEHLATIAARLAEPSSTEER